MNRRCLSVFLFLLPLLLVGAAERIDGAIAASAGPFPSRAEISRTARSPSRRVGGLPPRRFSEGDLMSPPAVLGNRRAAECQNAFTGAWRTSYHPVAVVALANASFNVLRPDPAIPLHARVPRVLWELSIALVATLASPVAVSPRRGQNYAHRPIPALHLLLSLITGSTALIDAFVWAPIFALTASFETCTGGGLFSQQPRLCTEDYVRGIGRVLVSAQCVLTAVFYLATAITSWGDFIAVRDGQVAERHAWAIADALGMEPGSE